MERRGIRLSAEIEILLLGGSERSQSVITEISRTGALIEAPAVVVPIGALVDLSITLTHGPPIEVEAKVVRHTANLRFAVALTWAPVERWRFKRMPRLAFAVATATPLALTRSRTHGSVPLGVSSPTEPGSAGSGDQNSVGRNNGRADPPKVCGRDWPANGVGTYAVGSSRRRSLECEVARGSFGSRLCAESG